MLAGWLLATPLVAHPDLERQIADVTSRIQVDPRNAELFLKRGELYRIHRNWEEAEADFRHARELSPDLATVDFFLGQLDLDAGRPEQAKKKLDRFLAREPNHARALVTRARALIALDKPLDAARDFDRAIAAYVGDEHPDPSFYLERAHALVDAGRVDAALRGLDEGLARLGQPVTLDLYAIELEQNSGRYDAALARVDRIAAAAQRKETWLVRRGEILEQAGRKDEARRAYHQAIEAIEGLPPSRKSTRAMLRLREEAEGAIERLDDATPEPDHG